MSEINTFYPRITELKQRLGELIEERLLDLDSLHAAQDRIVELEHQVSKYKTRVEWLERKDEGWL